MFAPQLAWNAIFKKKKLEVKLLSFGDVLDDSAKHSREHLLRSVRYVKANNKYMDALFYRTKEDLYILYIDANNFYTDIYLLTIHVKIHDFYKNIFDVLVFRELIDFTTRPANHVSGVGNPNCSNKGIFGKFEVVCHVIFFD